MKLKTTIICMGGLLLVIVAVGLITLPRSSQATKPLGYHPQHLLIKFKDVDSIQEIQKRYGLEVLKVFKQIDVYVVKTTESVNIPELAAHISAEDGVVYAEPDYIRRALAVPDDPLYPQQWDLHKVGVADYWDIEVGNSGVMVAIIDTGIDLAHEDLANQLWVNGGEIPDNGVDDDGNGYVDDIYGYDFAGDGLFPLPPAEDSVPDDQNGHGTWVAGRVAAQTNNGIGVAGMAPGVKLMAVRVLSKLGFGYSSDIIEGVFYSADNGAQVANMSLGGTDYSKAEYDAYDYAYGNNMFIAAASGNKGNSGNPISYPAGYAHNLAVAASDINDQIASFSTYGAQVEVSAPGANTSYSTVIGGYESGWSGTSMACPHAAGAAALLYSQYPSISLWQVRLMLREAVVDIETPGWDQYSGFGRLDMPTLLTIGPPPTDEEHLIMPVENSHLPASGTGVFSCLWSPVDGAISYNLYITLPTSKTLTINTTKTIYTVHPNKYLKAPTGKYEWQVDAMGSTGVISSASSYFYKE